MLKGRYQLLKGYQNNHVTIGFGSYGQVKLARNLDSGQIVAVKIINKLAKNQIIFHDKLSHPKIIQLLNYQIDKERQITYMVLEYADDGTLFEKIKTTSLSKDQIKSYFRDVCEAVFYLHNKEIMHRDIKPQNILLTKKGQAKLCDFGFAAILGQRKTLCGTYEYMSPQMIQNRPYDYKIDIWALGILLFQMISGQAPFRGQSPDEVLNQMKTKIYFCQRFETQQINLIKMILRVTPHKRPTVQQILDHPFFNEDKKSTKTQQTEVSLIKNLNNISSNSNLEKVKFHNKVQNVHFNKKVQRSQNQKLPQNSYPFYMPKAKYHTGGSTGSTGNSGSGASTKIIMPQNYNPKHDDGFKSDNTSPNKKDQMQNSKNSSQILKPHKIISKNPLTQFSGSQSLKPGNIIGNKGLNFSMGHDIKQKFNMWHGQQIKILNTQNNVYEGKGGMEGNINLNKTGFYPINKITSNRFS